MILEAPSNLACFDLRFHDSMTALFVGVHALGPSFQGFLVDVL